MQSAARPARILEPRPATPACNVLKMAREGLLHGLRGALQEARQARKAASGDEGLHGSRRNGATREVDLQVLPLVDASDTPHFLVLFEDRAARAVPPRRARRAPAHARNRRRSRASRSCEQELSASREYLQSIIQDLEAANEELQSANEEILSSNEELQSTNEELDTAKEELQSTNEELNTVNEELNARNEELSHAQQRSGQPAQRRADRRRDRRRRPADPALHAAGGEACST